MHKESPEVLEFIRRVDAGEAGQVDELLKKHRQLRENLSAPWFAFGKPAVVQARQNLELLDVLLAHGADINARSEWEPGSYGVLNETDSEYVQPLLERGAKLGIHAAVEHDLMSEVKRFLDEDPGAIDRRGPDGQLPLHYAQNVEMARYLLKMGADINARCIDHESLAAQYMCCERPEVARFLVEQGSETDIFLAAALGDQALAEHHIAKDADCLEQVIGRGPYEGHIYNWKLPSTTPYQIALDKEHHELAKCIYSHLSPRSQFLACCWAGDEAQAKDLLERHPHFIKELGEDERLVADAAWEKLADSVKLMLSLGFAVDTRGDHGSTPLDRACVRGWLEVVEAVLPFGPSFEVQNEFGGKPLTTALWGACHWCEGDHLAVIRRLLEEKAPGFHEMEHDGDLGYGHLLAWMADEGSMEILQLLLRYGASPLAKNRQGETAIEVAQRLQRDEVLRLFEEHLA